eukprot:CAMPEP_0180355356 /NCGR_PEP_ID=MMETSP0989-20121125/8732_1 /TAXON_ID=697907 /ORGANISM="non described non described, Strain CCMP2293" /LENGTH=132 /DNA_ID=CAMNT_0022345287 /DNA_START=107 /DNA_END=505 /DNA_ORIENTATION=-
MPVFTRLSGVFSVHRFIAGGFGLFLLVVPQVLVIAEYVSTFGENFALQSWGCFILGVAMIVNSARAFPPPAQRAVGQALFTTMALLTGLYAYKLATAEMTPEYRAGVWATGSVFAALLVAYGWALAETVKGA